MNTRKFRQQANQNAYHLRDLESWRFAEQEVQEEFYHFVHDVIWPKLSGLHKGYKLAAKKEIATQVTLNLIKASLTEKVVADGRGKKNGSGLRIKVWDSLVDAGYARMIRGSEKSGLVCRYQSTNELLTLRRIWRLDMLENLGLQNNSDTTKPSRHALVVLQTNGEDKKLISIREWILSRCPRDPNNMSAPDPKAVENGLSYFRDVEKSVNEINQENLKHTWTAHTFSEFGTKILFQPNVCLRQVHSNQLFRAVRFYSWGALSGQNMSKAQRNTIKIDGQQAAEIDSSCHAIRMLYHFAKIDERSDLYKTEQIFPKHPQHRELLRSFVKIATNVCLNVNAESKARLAVSNALRQHPDREILNEVIEATFKDRTIGLLRKMIEIHPAKVSEKFFTEIGLELMTTDSKIMHSFLRRLVVDKKRPCLAVHDSMVVKVSDVDEAAETYSECYYKFLTKDPVLKREF